MLKSKLGMAALALALSSTVAFAQGGGSDEKALQPGMGFCLELAKVSDANKDGMVSKEEFMKMAESRWARKDKAGKGMLTHQQAAELLMSFSGHSPL